MVADNMGGNISALKIMTISATEFISVGNLFAEEYMRNELANSRQTKVQTYKSHVTSFSTIDLILRSSPLTG